MFPELVAHHLVVDEDDQPYAPMEFQQVDRVRQDLGIYQEGVTSLPIETGQRAHLELDATVSREMHSRVWANQPDASSIG